MWFVGCAGRRQLGVNQFAFPGDRDGYPLGPLTVTAQRNEIKPPHGQAASNQLFSNVADRHDSSAPQNDAFNFRRLVRETKNAAWRNQLRGSVGGNRKSPFAQSQQDEGLQFEFGGDSHLILRCVNSIPCPSQYRHLSHLPRSEVQGGEVPHRASTTPRPTGNP